MRLVARRVATLQEVETWYSLVDVIEMNEVLDAIEDAEHEAHRRAQQQQQR